MINWIKKNQILKLTNNDSNKWLTMKWINVDSFKGAYKAAYIRWKAIVTLIRLNST